MSGNLCPGCRSRAVVAGLSRCRVCLDSNNRTPSAEERRNGETYSTEAAWQPRHDYENDAHGIPVDPRTAPQEVEPEASIVRAMEPAIGVTLSRQQHAVGRDPQVVAHLGLAVGRDAKLGECGVCGARSLHFRGCADCSFTVSRCEACGGNKAASREQWLHRQREHGVQMQLVGTETPSDPVLEEHPRPRFRGDCEPCGVCQALSDSGELALHEPGTRLACGHLAQDAANHCRPCPWVGCRHHALLEIAKAKPGRDPQQCSVDGCERKSHARGVCRSHYANLVRTGDPVPRAYNVKPLTADESETKRDARPTTIRLNRAQGKLGRRTGLHAQDPVDVVQRWIDDAVEHLDEMPHTCTLDVADDNPDGFPLVDVAELLGVTTAAIKEEVGPAGEALRRGLAEFKDHVPEDHTPVLATAQQR